MLDINISLGPNINFVLETRNMEKAVAEMVKAPFCHVGAAVSPDLRCIKKHHKAARPVNVRFKQAVSYLFRGLPNDIREIQAG